jgi:hypothetical protein
MTDVSPYLADERFTPADTIDPLEDVHQHHVFLAALGEVVYAIRTKDGAIKIGHTTAASLKTFWHSSAEPTRTSRRSTPH